MPLSGKQRRALRALGHHLVPVVAVGKEGIGAALISAVDQALADHELIKVKVGESSPVDRREAAVELAEATGSEVAQVLGRTMLLFRRHPEEPKIALPDLPLPKVARPAAPAAKSEPKGRTASRKPVMKKKPMMKTKPVMKKKPAAKRAPR